MSPSRRDSTGNWRLGHFRTRVVLRHASRELKDAEPAAVQRVLERLKHPQPPTRHGLFVGRAAWFLLAAPSLVAFASGVWVGTRAEREGMFGSHLEARLSADPSGHANAVRNVALQTAMRPAGGGVLERGMAQGAVVQSAGYGVENSAAGRALLAEFGPPAPAERSKTESLLEVFRRPSGELLLAPGQAASKEGVFAPQDRALARDPHFSPEAEAALGSPLALQTSGSDAVAPEAPPIAVREAPAVDLGDAPWQLEANAGDYAAALAALKQSGGFEQVLRHASAEQLMLLFDVSRAAGQQQRALASLRRIVTEFRSDPVAPLAAWSLGTLLEKSGDQAGARRAFATYRLLAPAGEFAEDSIVRELRYAIAAGDKDSAHQLIAAYENDFPTGRQRGEIARLAKRLTKRSASAGDAGPEVEEPTSEDSE